MRLVDTTTFEMIVSVEDDRMLSADVALVTHAAEYAGCHAGAAATFAGTVQSAVVASLVEPRSGPLPIVVRRRAGPVEVLVNGHILTLDV